MSATLTVATTSPLGPAWPVADPAPVIGPVSAPWPTHIDLQTTGAKEPW